MDKGKFHSYNFAVTVILLFSVKAILILKRSYNFREAHPCKRCCLYN
jgi:hypothetical protein